MADYDWFDPSPDVLARQREEARAKEAEEWRIGFRELKRSTSTGGFVPTMDFLQCLGCGCLIGDGDVHREKCAWTPRVPQTIYVEEDKK